MSALSRAGRDRRDLPDERRQPEPDPELRDTENVPLKKTWSLLRAGSEAARAGCLDQHQRKDHKDGEVGKVGYEINFNRYFYQYQPPRTLEEIEADIKGIEKDILAMLKEVTG